MKNYVAIIFVVSTISYQAGAHVSFDEQVTRAREKVTCAYRCACEDTRAVYETMKEHKKLIMGALAYLAFEGIGYLENWDTPLRRLLTSRKLLDDALKKCQKFEAECKKLEKLKTEFEELKADYEKLKKFEARCEELEKQLKEREKQLEDKVLEEFKRAQESLTNTFEKFMT